MSAGSQFFDALVVGAGFAGIYQLKKLLDQGLNVIAIDSASDVGGTWYWNRYPGAMSDTQSFLYRFSWDREDLEQYPWPNHYLQGPECLAYLKHVVERHNLRKHFQLDTELLEAQWSDEDCGWTAKLSTNQVVKVKYLVTGLGLLSKTNFPNIPNLDKFQGELYHTARWPEDADLKGKHVGVIGNGSTGVQLITAIAKANEVKELICFQRNPQYTVPASNSPVSTQYRQDVNKNYQKIWSQARNSLFGFGFEESQQLTFDVCPEERERIYEEAWQKGNGFRFMFGTFADITVNEKANREASEFIKKKIRTIVEDPAKAEKLCPTEYYARRPLCDVGYYEQFNRENVDIVDIKTNPIVEMISDGVQTADGQVYKLDVLVCATGFDAVDGNYTRIAIKGRNGVTLKDHWACTGPTAYLGIAVPNFPNLFIITGPKGPFSNIPPTIECHVDIISDLIQRAENKKKNPDVSASVPPLRGIVEAEAAAEKEWTQHCDELCAGSLFGKIDSSWIFGKNIAGKKPSVLFYFGGLGPYMKTVQGLIDDNLKGFKPLR